MIHFKALKFQDMGRIVEWRNERMSQLRTPYMLTYENQNKFYEEVICNRNSRSRFWAVYNGNQLIGMAGIENIEWENRRGEFSLLLDVTEKDKTKEAINILIQKGFNELNLENLWSEVYFCSLDFDDWMDTVKLYNGYKTTIPAVKYYDGLVYNAVWYNINKKLWEEIVK